AWPPEAPTSSASSTAWSTIPTTLAATSITAPNSRPSLSFIPALLKRPATSTRSPIRQAVSASWTTTLSKCACAAKARPSWPAKAITAAPSSNPRAKLPGRDDFSRAVTSRREAWLQPLRDSSKRPASAHVPPRIFFRSRSEIFLTLAASARIRVSTGADARCTLPAPQQQTTRVGRRASCQRKPRRQRRKQLRRASKPGLFPIFVRKALRPPRRLFCLCQLPGPLCVQCFPDIQKEQGVVAQQNQQEDAARILAAPGIHDLEEIVRVVGPVLWSRRFQFCVAQHLLM